MIILGLHFGHDASITVLQDGKVLICVELERHRRIKHAIGINYEDVINALAECEISINQIDYCTITTTQLVEYIFTDSKKLYFEVGSNDDDKISSTLINLGISSSDFSKMGIGWLNHILTENPNHIYNMLLSEKHKQTMLETNNFLEDYEYFIDTNIWNKSKTLREISDTDYSPLLNDELRNGFHYPARLFLNNIQIPSFIFSHHYAHICYSFYESPYYNSALLSNDGAGGGYLGYACGFFGYGEDNKVYPYTPNTLTVGEIYDASAAAIGLDAGKLMGLSSYGSPKFFNKNFVGNWYDNNEFQASEWVDYCTKEAKVAGYCLDNFGKKNKITDPVNVDFAASTQKLSEEILLQASSSLFGSMNKSGLYSQNLCFSGGVALNCPANTRLFNESKFESVFIPPAINDAGLSIGSAYALYYNHLNNPRLLNKTSPKIAYQGYISSSEIKEEQLNIYENKICYTKFQNIEKEIANELDNNNIVALFTGRSEIGPRALCHRSIIANPQYKENWERVNKIKERELWRPFAPVVLEGHENNYFDNCPFPSYFMLFNANVTTNKLPAITHVDNTSRIQSINKECGLIYKVLEEYMILGNKPVLLNTSFNGKAQPIIEKIEEAINFLLESEIDSLYTDNYKLSRKKQ